MPLSSKTYLGIVVSGEDKKNKGRYKVHIPELHIDDPENVGVYAYNRVNNHYVRNNEKTGQEYGSYHPIQVGTRVIVRVYNGNIETAEIIGIVGDNKINALPLNAVTSDRDEFYVLVKTPKENTLFVVTENSTSLPASSIHIYHKNKNTVVIIDSNGIHIKSPSMNVTVSDLNINISGNCNIHASGTINVSSGSSINVNAPSINLGTGSGNNPGYASKNPQEINV